MPRSKCDRGSDQILPNQQAEVGATESVNAVKLFFGVVIMAVMKLSPYGVRPSPSRTLGVSRADLSQAPLLTSGENGPSVIHSRRTD